MASFLNDSDRTLLLHRLEALTPESRSRWGKFSVDGMLSHLRESVRMAGGALAVVDRQKRVFKTFPVKHLILYVLPFPKGAPTATELLATAPADFTQTRAELRAELDAFLAAPEGPIVAHPLFGPLTRREWGVLLHKHMDHHLRQFGC
ncbi:MAG: DUF1569 domain-containing protein [Acidobacteria bacterium]|nr:DUF1569 domain-containing protein [Acidobacteriota bacterium]